MRIADEQLPDLNLTPSSFPHETHTYIYTKQRDTCEKKND